MIPNLYEKVTVLACQGRSWSCSAHGFAPLVAAALAIFCCAWWYWWRSAKFTEINPPLPPGPRGLPILGNLPFIKQDLHHYFTELSESYGPIFKLQLGTKICIVINSPPLVKEVLQDQDAIFANRDLPAAAIVSMFGGLDIAWRPNGPEHNRLRKLIIREIMSKKSLDTCYALRRHEIQQMVKDIHWKIGSPVNLGEQISLTTVKVMISTLWGGSSERSCNLIELRKRLDEFVRLFLAPNVSDIFPVLAPFDLQGIVSKSKKHMSWFYEIFESVITSRLKSGDDGKKIVDEINKDFLQKMLELNQREDDKSYISINEVKAVLLDLMVGGTDTIPTTIEWAMTELLRHPDIMMKLAEELDTVVEKQNMVEESHLPRLHYLDAVIKETLRLHPVIPLLLPHMPSKTSIVAGYTIPKHSRVFINAWAMQRDPRFWDDPLRFQPERFLKGNNNHRGNSFQYLPFGSGRRICVGLALAEKMVAVLLGALVHSFEWELPRGAKPDVQEKFGVVLKKKEALVAIPVARLSNPKQYK
ncbi:cytochrome P450, family 706, subfamily A, polypeptide 6 [Hibiscus trionum]|uniref:Cytochrome P450, family 706, subfamily A, polypeptide 6 n=1 Tax=Hibiscus trionum TaxID=183268 RepID=A0A9W7MTN8_HIBTR|nr:cytochrome P450, family 706, subfamily A, polypeptide 6 [Hibiscus trionum]